MSLSVEILRGVATALRREANSYAEATDERETFEDAADAVLDAADLTEALNG